MAAPTDPRERKALLALTSTAFAFRFALLLLPRVIRWDEPVYLLLGRNLWSGLGFTFSGHPELHHSPLFPLLAGATLKLTGRPEAASDVWYVLFGTLLILHRHTGQWMISGKLGITYEIGRAVETGDPVLYDEIINTLDADGEIRAASEARYQRGEAGTAAVKPAEASGRFLRNLGHVLRSSLSSEIFSALLLVSAAWWLVRGAWKKTRDDRDMETGAGRRLEGEILVAARVAPVTAFLA